MCLGPLIFVLLHFLLMLFNPLLDKVFSLLYEGMLEPFFEFHVADLLLLLLFETVTLLLLDTYKLFVVDMLLFARLPLEHCVSTLLHRHC